MFFTPSARETLISAGARSILQRMEIVLGIVLSVALIAGLLIGLDELLNRQPR